MKKFKYLLIILIGLFILIPSASASSEAKTLKELRGELQTLKNKKSSQDSQKKKTKSEITNAKNDVYNSQQAIVKGQEQIEQAKKNIEILTSDINSTKENIKKLMNNYQIAQGENIYLDYLFNAESYADLVYRYSIIKQILNYNNEQVETWENKVTENEELQKELAKKEIELNENISKLEKNIESLNGKLEEITEITMDIQDEISSTQELIDYYVKIGCTETESLEACVKVKGDTGFRKPLTKGTITSYFGYRKDPIKKVTKFHSGTDIGGNKEGTNVYSTANGMVGKIIKKASCGGNQVYIYHTINGKKYTSAYLHLLTINVKVGDSVTSNTVIGTVGGGRGTKSYETCSTGAHLHFTIASGWYGKDYTSYSTFLSKTQDPQKILNLPNKGTYWFSR